MKLTEDDIVYILRLVRESSFSELLLETEDLKLIVNKGKDANTSIAKKEESTVVSSAALAKTATEQKVQDQEIQSTEQKEGLVSIAAPLLGIFYRCPEPGAPPYVDEGSLVENDTTVCLIEVMKVFNAVKAGVRGYIRRICAESGQLVEYGQTLFLVEPAESPEGAGAKEA